ncbi:MAG: hypothetical protein N2260_06785 [Syntrophobacterales bacterium]|nr:hypothetical protein [Syntrophobacterales bacterium]
MIAPKSSSVGYIIFKILVAIILLTFCRWLMAYIALPTYTRIDLFLYLIVGTASVLKPLHHLFLAIVLGYFTDALSGRLWGFHIATYVCAVALIHLSADEMEMRSLPYQVILSSICVAIQSLFIVIYAINSYESFPNTLEFVISVLVPRFALTMLGAIIFLRAISLWIGNAPQQKR